MADNEQYDEYTVVWDGTLESIVLVSDGEVFEVEYGTETYPQSVDGWLAAIERGASESQTPVEVYVLSHGHSPDSDGECVCAQYLTDHHPDYTFGGYDNG